MRKYLVKAKTHGIIMIRIHQTKRAYNRESSYAKSLAVYPKKQSEKMLFAS